MLHYGVTQNVLLLFININYIGIIWLGITVKTRATDLVTSWGPISKLDEVLRHVRHS